MKKSLLSFLLFSLLLTAAAVAGTNPANNNSNNNNSNTDSNDKGTADKDTVKVPVNTAIFAPRWDVNDSLIWIPAYDTYCQWDTSIIHPYHFEEIWYDTTTLVLQIETENPYSHPFMGEVSSNFGYRRHRMHYGIDINLETGDTVVAAFDGKVRIAKMNKSYGNLVVVRHNNGLETYYAHLDQLLVEPDQEVQAGQVIGLGGNTGRSYGSHLHFEVRYKGKPIDPNELIDFSSKKLLADTFLITQKHADDLGVVKKSGGKQSTKVPYAKNYDPKKNKPAAKAKYHTVRKGETLSSISKKYGTNPKTLAQKNGMSTKSTLAVGKKLRI
jgi:murein DD-endopeptidase MepM/ murein hydrolase activator NlpD